MTFDLEQLAAVLHRQAWNDLATVPVTELDALMERLTATAEERLAAARAGREEVRLACQAGCSSCCILNVTVLFPEVAAIAGYLKREWSAAEIDQLRAGAGSSPCFADDSGEILRQQPCLFLAASQACRIYPVRPLLCRAVTSTDAEICRRALAAEPSGESVPVIMDLQQKATMETAFCVLAQAIDDHRLDSRGMLLVPAVCALLGKPGLAAEWLSGKALDF